jgi:RNA ligase (TIGR02306 family)
MSSRILARVVKIIEIIPMEKSHTFDLACVLGYTCCVLKTLYQVGDLCIFISPESILPVNEDTRHLEEKGTIRIKARKICGVLSEGYIAPLSWVTRYNVDPTTLTEAQIVTDILQITQWVSAEEKEDKQLPGMIGTKNVGGGILGSLIPKTDERQIKDAPYLLRQLADRDIVITIKMDGCSATYAWYPPGAIGRDNQQQALIFSRNLDVTGVNGSSYTHYHTAFTNHKLAEQLEKYHREIAIQGELCSPSINNGRTLIPSLTYLVFNIYDITNKRYLLWSEVASITEGMNLNLVPTLYHGRGLPEHLQTKQQLLEYVETLRYDSGVQVEGIVIKTDDDKEPRISLKVISESYLLNIENEITLRKQSKPVKLRKQSKNDKHDKTNHKEDENVKGVTVETLAPVEK